MFIHNFKYTLKTLLKNKMLIFWTFAFPIILGTFFNMAFADLEKGDKLDIIDIAIVENEEWENNIIYKEAFKVLSDDDNQEQLFKTKYMSLEEAKKLLNDNQITGYLVFGDEIKVVVKQNGINETILKYVVEELMQSEAMMNMISEKKINIKDISRNNLSYTMIEFYTLIAMACLYGGILGMVAINQNLANMSSNGKRVSVSPVSKFTLVSSSVLASYITQLIGIALLFIYTILVLKVDYGNNLIFIILLALVGCLAGLSLGVATSCLFKTNDNVKTGIILSITMLGCFLSGMMGITMKYIIDKNIPIINKINPANMITDGFYSLYYYDTLDRFYFNIISLLLFALIMIVASMFSLRRQKYDSI